MVDVSLFANILTLKEAFKFDHIKESNYQLTSCCCPVWIVPIIASGRTIKYMHPNALSVFIGSCMTKKAEAKEPDLVGAIDYVLTFQEVKDIFDTLKIDPSKMEESEKDHSSRAGRIYARTDGVSEAVRDTLNRLNPDHPIPIRTKQADGVATCKAMVNDLIAGNAYVRCTYNYTVRFEYYHSDL